MGQIFSPYHWRMMPREEYLVDHPPEDLGGHCKDFFELPVFLVHGEHFTLTSNAERA